MRVRVYSLRPAQKPRRVSSERCAVFRFRSLAMKRLAGWRRWLLVAGLFLVVAVLSLRQFLVWGGATNTVVNGLERQLGVEVAATSSRVTLLGNSSLRGLKLYEKGYREPFLRARRVKTDLNALGYLFGRRQPRRLE